MKILLLLITLSLSVRAGILFSKCRQPVVIEPTPLIDDRVEQKHAFYRRTAPGTVLKKKLKNYQNKATLEAIRLRQSEIARAEREA